MREHIDSRKAAGMVINDLVDENARLQARVAELERDLAVSESWKKTYEAFNDRLQSGLVRVYEERKEAIGERDALRAENARLREQLGITDK